MSNVDLSKPLRHKKTKNRYYPTTGTEDNGLIRGVIFDPKNDWAYRSYYKEELENIPETIVRHIALYICEDGGVSIWQSDVTGEPVYRKSGDVLLKLTRTEDGKTQVEVCDD